jgi:hypothetical protein
VATHIHHAVKPAADLANGGEQELIDHYLDTPISSLGGDTQYLRKVVTRPYRLVMADYFQFFFRRVWNSDTEKKKTSKNTALSNRDVVAAIAFL